jgi:hypothetical protein
MTTFSFKSKLGEGANIDLDKKTKMNSNIYKPASTERAATG